MRFHDLRHFAATMFASTGASTKEIMSRGGWKSVAMVVRYEHASEERDALLAQALNPYTDGGNVIPIGIAFDGDRARSAHVARTPTMRLKVRSYPYHRRPAISTTKAPGERLELST
ncbi:MAG TPA: tyrosine-type recombinase/integrase [Solirubrobacterales bacterium]